MSTKLAAAHMGFMTTSAAIPLWNELSLKRHKPPAEYHRVQWFLHDTVTAEMECLHEPLSSEFICDAVSAEEDQPLFLESLAHEAGKVPLREGVIKTWWTGEDEDAQMWWRYATDAEIESLPEVVRNPDHVSHVVSGDRGTVMGADPGRSGRFLIRWDTNPDGGPESHDEADFERGTW